MVWARTCLASALVLAEKRKLASALSLSYHLGHHRAGKGGTPDFLSEKQVAGLLGTGSAA